MNENPQIRTFPSRWMVWIVEQESADPHL